MVYFAGLRTRSLRRHGRTSAKLSRDFGNVEDQEAVMDGAKCERLREERSWEAGTYRRSAGMGLDKHALLEPCFHAMGACYVCGDIESIGGWGQQEYA